MIETAKESLGTWGVRMKSCGVHGAMGSHNPDAKWSAKTDADA